MDPKLRRLLVKTAILIFSLSTAWYLVRSGVLHDLVAAVLPIRFAAEFVTGMFYTSFLTSPIAVALIIALAENNNPIILALLAGFGAAFTDLLIVKIFKEKLSTDFNLISHQLQLKKVSHLLVKWRLDFVTPLLGAIIIASPAPDELGLMMLGASRLKYRDIAILTYILNTAGILLVALPINLL